jgi:hypothetical protein
LKATIDINDHECNVITGTEDDIDIFFQLEGNDVKVSLRDFGSYVKFNKECYHKGYKSGKVKNIPHCPTICSTCCGAKVAQIKNNWKIRERRLKENSCQFWVASEMKSKKIGIQLT